MPDGSADIRARNDWEDLGRIDPEWAILSEPGKRFGGWDTDDFFASGRADVDRAIARAGERSLLAGRRRALDVGCGIGRLTVALADHFDEVVGVDFSESMLTRARELHGEHDGVRFLQAPADDLGILETGTFDLVFTRIVLQHLPSKRAILRAFDEMLRLLRPGGLLIAQTTSELPLHHRLQTRARLYWLLRRLGVSAETLYRRFQLQPMRMTVISTGAVQTLLEHHGATLHDAERELKNAGAVWTTYWVTK